MLKQSPGLQSYKGFGVPTIGRYTPKGTFYRGEKPSDYSARMLKEKGDSLAQFSGINPESIVGNQTPTKETALKLISGDIPLGSSIASTAANKIVGFNRPGVAPKPSGMGSLLETLTPSITNNTTNILGNKKTSNVLNTNIGDKKTSNVFNTNIGDKKTSNVFNTNNTTNILGSSNKKEQGGGLFSFISGALDKVKEALAFVTFFGSKKNLDRIRDNIQNLKLIFTETFDIAKALRKAIIKIFKQLSGIDTSGGGGGGGGGIIGLLGRLIGGVVGGYITRLIRKIFPGFKGFKGAKAAEEGVEEGSRLGRLGRAVGGGARVAEEGGMLSKIGKFLPKLGKPGKILAGGLAVAGAGAAISGLSKPGEQEGEVQPDGSPMDIPGTILDKFNSILDRFDKAIDRLMKKGPSGPSSGSGKGSGGGAGGTAGDGKARENDISPGPSSYSPGTIPNEVSKDTEFTKGVSELAKKYDVPEDYLYAAMGFESGGTFSPSKRNEAGSGATGLIQFMPDTAKGLGTTTDALSKMTRAQQLKYVDKYFSGTLNKGASLSDVYMSILMPAAVGKPDNTVLFGPGGIMPGGYAQNAGLDLNKDGKVTKAEATKRVESYLPRQVTQPGKQRPTNQQPSAPTLPPPGTPPTQPAPGTQPASSQQPASRTRAGTSPTRPAPGTRPRTGTGDSGTAAYSVGPGESFIHTVVDPAPPPGTRPTSPTRPSVVQPAPNQKPQAAQLTQAAQSTTSPPNVSVINTGQAQQPSKPSGSGTISLPSPPKNGPSVPFPSPKNPDNFLVFYSRLTYNIIDG